MLKPYVFLLTFLQKLTSLLVVRFGLPQMVIASLALHLGVGAGIALSYFHTKATSTGDANSDSTVNMIMLGSVETPNLSPTRASTPQASSALAGARPAPTPLPPQPPPAPVKKALPPVAPTAFLALEANPNAHLRNLPPEEILSPRAAPHLDGAAATVFVLDVSGSMYEPYAGATRLAYARAAVARRINALPNGTPFAVVMYAERSRPSGPLIAASDLTREAAIRFIMQDVDCGGGTNLPDGLGWAVQLHTGKIVVVSDGDLNTTLHNLLAQTDPLLGPKGTGPALSVVGIAPRAETGDMAMLQTLADRQGGVYCTEQLDDAATLLANRTIPPSP